jgi:hypothetical protein
LDSGIELISKNLRDGFGNEMLNRLPNKENKPWSLFEVNLVDVEFDVQEPGFKDNIILLCETAAGEKILRQ